MGIILKPKILGSKEQSYSLFYVKVISYLLHCKDVEIILQLQGF